MDGPPAHEYDNTANTQSYFSTALCCARIFLVRCVELTLEVSLVNSHNDAICHFI